MFSTRRIAALMVAALLGTDASAESQLQVNKWWQSAEVRAALALTDEQASQIEQIFQETMPKLRTHKAELDRIEAELSQLLRDRNVVEADVIRQIDRVEQARSALSKVRTLMLFRIHRVLSAEQRVELRNLIDRRKKNDRCRRGTP